MSSINKYAVLVAGGKGTRMGTHIPKQFLPLLSLPVLCHSIMAFAHAIPNIKLILVVPEIQLNSACTILKSYMGHLDVTTVTGGETRYDSVKNGLKLVENDGVVFVHDAVRPLVSQELIQRCYAQAVAKGSAIPVIPVSDSMRLINDEDDSIPLNRDMIRIVQTPQTFMTNIILPAFDAPYHPTFTDEATVVEAFGTKVYLINGELDNIKITNPTDMILADTLLKASV
jgi:2-C-methyl-D-erythritol 4-phosphate cytidylyltransferase